MIVKLSLMYQAEVLVNANLREIYRSRCGCRKVIRSNLRQDPNSLRCVVLTLVDKRLATANHSLFLCLSLLPYFPTYLCQI